MKRRLTVRQLKSILREAVLREGPEDGSSLPKEMNDSLDKQVDRYFTQYESEAKSSGDSGGGLPADLPTESVDFRTMTRQWLSEAGQGDQGGDDAGDDDTGGGDTGGGDEPLSDDDNKLTLEDIDVESFADSVVRLIENYDSLLEVQSTLVRRAKNFLSKTYDTDVTEMFEKVLRETHGIVAGESKQDVADEDFVAPKADRAGEGPPGAGGAPA